MERLPGVCPPPLIRGDYGDQGNEGSCNYRLKVYGLQNKWELK